MFITFFLFFNENILNVLEKILLLFTTGNNVLNINVYVVSITNYFLFREMDNIYI